MEKVEKKKENSIKSKKVKDFATAARETFGILPDFPDVTKDRKFTHKDLTF